MARRQRAKRTAQVAALGLRGTANLAAAKARGVGKSDDEKARLRERAELRTAEQAVEQLGNMKGALMKIGQMASYIDQSLPEHVRVALAELQQNAPPMSFELVETALRAELGSLSGFAEIDPEPLAAASIGQVHRAVTAEGRDVAVKIQYPGVDVAIEADLANSELLFTMMGAMFPGLDPAPIAEELRERLTEELDYTAEAAYQRRFADYYRDHPTIHIPAVIDNLSARRVLTTEFADGVGFEEVCRRDDDQRNAVGETIYRFVFGGIYRLGLFNGDPHPGNYRFGDDGRVTFLDFGLCKEFTQAELGQFERMIRAMVFDSDIDAFVGVCRSAGFVPDGVTLDADDAWTYFSHFYELVLHQGPLTVTPEYSSGMTKRFFDRNGEHGEIIKSINLPRSMVIVQRINLGLFALLGDLRATCDWRMIAEEIWPFVPDPELVTPMGEEIRRWEARRTHIAK